MNKSSFEYDNDAPEAFKIAAKALINYNFKSARDLFQTAAQNIEPNTFCHKVATGYISALEEEDQPKSETNNARTNEEKLVLIEKKAGNIILMSKKDPQIAAYHYTRALKFAGYNEDQTNPDVDQFLINDRPEYNTTHNNIAILLNNRATALHVIASLGTNVNENLLRALNDAEKSIQFDSSYVKAHWRRGSILLRLGRHKDAIHSLKRAYALHHSDQIENELNKARAAWHSTQEYKLKQYVAYDRALVPVRQDVWRAADSVKMKELLGDSNVRQMLTQIYQDPNSIKTIAEDEHKKEQLEDLMKNFYYDYRLEIED